jgi:hypothetical protein
MNFLGLIKSNGQDISRKGKSKNLMVLFPSEFAFQKGTEGILGYLVKLESPHPELVIETEIVSDCGNQSFPGDHFQGNLRYRGRYINTSSQYLSIVLQPRKCHSLCQDITSRVLIFDEVSGDFSFSFLNCAESRFR